MAGEFEEMVTPTLTFGAEATQEAPAAQARTAEEKAVANQVLEDAKLSPEELKQVEAFVKQIDIGNSRGIMEYGAGTQKKLAEFSEKTLENVRTKDLGEAGKAISDLMVELKGFDAEHEKKGLFRRKADEKIVSLRAKYGKVEKNVEQITHVLEQHQVTLLKDVEVLDRMYDLNMAYFKEISMYILAGKKRLAIARDEELAELRRKAEETGSQEDVQKARDFADMCDRLEKKIYDLELTRNIALQTAPQLRLVQNSDAVMAEKIQSTIVNTIPLWKNQMVIAVGIEHTAQAARAQREVTNTTNELLKKNAEAMKLASVEAAREAERGIVDIETLQQTNQTLIQTLDEVLTIQKDGREKRANAEVELARIEEELKNKLLELAKG